ncbi:MAG: chorismate mutase [Abditibacteriota bacterium]|nr:chorismate mutase [Abditibacteriota bacterium]
MNEQEEIRREIARTDKEMALLFEKRMKAAGRIAIHKKKRGLSVDSAETEKTFIENNSALISDPVLRAHYIKFLHNAISVFRSYQRELISGSRIAYSGIAGSFAAIAAERIFPDALTVNFPGFAEAWKAVAEGDCEQAVLPVENSYAGEVGQVADLMFHGSLFINAVYKLRIRQNLLAPKGSRISDIRTVRSHPQALSQCREYIKIHGFREEEAINTAMAAESVAREGDIHTAAIASMETAELYGLSVLDHDIQTSFSNETRFAVFSRVQNTLNDKKTCRFMLMFTVRNEAGSLAEAISVIGRYGFNMCSLRSRPLGSSPWQYYFCMEAEGEIFSAEGREMMNALAKNCGILKIAGSFSEPEEI